MISQYEKLCVTPSDINQHLPILKAYAEQCEHITEFGVRSCISSWAFIEAKPKTFVGYDIVKHANMKVAAAYCSEHKINVGFFIESTLEADIDNTDFLFLDTIHTYKQVFTELFLNAQKVKKYIGFHDVVSFGYKNELEETDENFTTRGIMPAILDFLLNNTDWHIDYFTTDNNGLLIIKRIE